MTDPDPRDPGLDRAYRDAAREEPPGALDERIRAAARRAVSAGPQSPRSLEAARARDERRRSWASRWRVPLSIAATVVIAVALTLRMQHEEQAPAYREVPEAPRAPAAVSTPAPAPPPVAAQPSAPATPPPAADSAATAAPQRNSAVQVESQRPEPASPPARNERAAEAMQPAPAESARSVPEPAESRQQTAVPAAVPPPPPAAAPALRAAPKPGVQAPPAAPAAEGLSRDRALGDRPSRAMREAGAAAIRTPEAWIEHIRSLRTQGREAEAAAELAELRRAYPDFPVPADLAR